MTEKKQLKYVGIGPRAAGEDAIDFAKECGQGLAEMGWLLRSGGGEGMDEAFEQGAIKGGGKTEIFIPEFNWRKRSNTSDKVVHHLPKHIEAIGMMQPLCPSWGSLGTQVQLFLVRNVFALLGEKLDDPVDMVVTSNQYPNTGTAHLIEMAKNAGIPVFNIRDDENINKMEDFVMSFNE